MNKKYRVWEIGYAITGTMGSGETFRFNYEVVLHVQDGFVEMIEMNKYISHKDIERYFQMSIDEYFEHEMVAYRCNQEDVEFRSLEPLNKDGYIICREMMDFRDLSLIKRNWVYNKAVDKTGTKVIFEKYMKEYYPNVEYEIIE